MPQPAAVVARLGGIATRQQLLMAGCHGTDLTRAVRLGELSRIRQARYASADAPFEALVAARVGGLLAGPSAARAHGLWGGFDRSVHVSVKPNGSRLRLARDPVLRSDRFGVPIVVHWLRGGGVDERGRNAWLVPIEECLRQVARWCDRETAIACLDVAATRHSPRMVRRALAGEPWRIRALLASVRVGSDSGLESIVRQRLARLGIVVRQQVFIAGVGRVDMLVEGRLVIEIDGTGFHSDPAAVENDRRRNAELTARGLGVVRLSYPRITQDWAWCERIVIEALSHHSGGAVSGVEF